MCGEQKKDRLYPGTGYGGKTVQVKLNVLSKSTRLQDWHLVVPVSLASAAGDVRSAVEWHTNVKATNVRTKFILTTYRRHERYWQIIGYLQICSATQT
mmetsp:Transcript_32050/g.69179  ORF Transcript_32050/g.69179 Transcript_32050/m.69179 type:complete len:98 (-) Transcript_32050:36-329(-)